MSNSYLISAGEPSGDLLGADLVRALATEFPGWQSYGIAGPRMRAAGVEALVPMEGLAVMGFVEVLRHLPDIKAAAATLLAQVDRRRPAFAVLIDYPGFHLHLAEQLRLRGIRVYQYVAPQLWAWGAKRTARLKAVTDGVLGIMPFEESFFRERGVNYTYVGTPQVDRVLALRRQREPLGLKSDQLVVGFFPGSRVSEVTRILPVMQRVIQEVQKRAPAVQVVVSAAPGLPLHLFAELQKAGIMISSESSLELMACSDAALVTSGTATLECALTGTPLAVMYVLNRMSYWLAQRVVKVPSISLVNLVAGEPLVKEFIQDVDVHALAEHLLALAQPGPVRSTLQAALEKLPTLLKGQPAQHAAAWLAAAPKELLL